MAAGVGRPKAESTRRWAAAEDVHALADEIEESLKRAREINRILYRWAVESDYPFLRTKGE